MAKTEPTCLLNVVHPPGYPMRPNARSTRARPASRERALGIWKARRRGKIIAGPQNVTTAAEEAS
jgi:hypothetical protein